LVATTADSLGYTPAAGSSRDQFHRFVTVYRRTGSSRPNEPLEKNATLEFPEIGCRLLLDLIYERTPAHRNETKPILDPEEAIREISTISQCSGPQCNATKK
jgi:hypothetical protein